LSTCPRTDGDGQDRDDDKEEEEEVGGAGAWGSRSQHDSLREPDVAEGNADEVEDDDGKDGRGMEEDVAEQSINAPTEAEGGINAPTDESEVGNMASNSNEEEQDEAPKYPRPPPYS